MLLGRFEDALAVLGEQRLVSGHHVLARRQRLEDQALRRFVAAEKFNHNINIGPRDQRVGVPGNELRG